MPDRYHVVLVVLLAGSIWAVSNRQGEVIRWQERFAGRPYVAIQKRVTTQRGPRVIREVVRIACPACPVCPAAQACPAPQLARYDAPPWDQAGLAVACEAPAKAPAPTEAPRAVPAPAAALPEPREQLVERIIEEGPVTERTESDTQAEPCPELVPPRPRNRLVLVQWAPGQFGSLSGGMILRGRLALTGGWFWGGGAGSGPVAGIAYLF